MRTALIHPVILRGREDRDADHASQEAESLVRALDVTLISSEKVTLQRPEPGTFFGSGKVDEIGAALAADEIDLVVINGPVSPVQQRNLERAWEVKLLDRTALILEIFGARARTREGVLQVDLAHLTYQKSRLVRSWTHLERQRGGGGFMGGPGETQIESDRRAIDDAIVRLKRQLSKVVRTRALHRAARAKVPFPIVALVGYTNAGKSTIFNAMTGADVMARDMVFATLDPTMRLIALPDGREAILSDTVGFISDLPTQLVAAFRATLEEVLGADLVVHVRDIAHPETELQAQNVSEILDELGVDEAAQAGMIEVWNKLDRLAPEAHDAALTAAARDAHVIAASALTGEGLDRLAEHIAARLRGTTRAATLRLGAEDGRARAWLYAQRLVTDERFEEDIQLIDVRWTAEEEGRFIAQFGHNLATVSYSTSWIQLTKG